MINFKSCRGFPLVYQDGISTSKLVLTVEDYMKWYDIYAVSPSGQVLQLMGWTARQYEEENPGDVAWSDHVPTPHYCQWLGLIPEFEWDPRSLEKIIERWYERYE